METLIFPNKEDEFSKNHTAYSEGGAQRLKARHLGVEI